MTTYILCSADENHLKDNEAKLHALLMTPEGHDAWNVPDKGEAWTALKDEHGLKSSFHETDRGGHFPSSYVCGVCGAPMVSVTRAE